MPSLEEKISALLEQMTLDEKVGQLCQLNLFNAQEEEDACHQVRQGNVGSFVNLVDAEVINRYQHIAVNESRLGIPLLFGRDVIHGFKTIFPIPLGQGKSS